MDKIRVARVHAGILFVLIFRSIALVFFIKDIVVID
jgi:hypothetical protein